jgi:hypothetical protein
MKSFFLILLASLFFCLSQTAHSAVLCVAKDGSCPYTSIQAAVNTAITDDTVKVMPGTYDEAISITKKILLLGHGHETTAIAYTGSTVKSAVEFSTPSAGAKISGFRITSLTADGIFVNNPGGDVYISNCFICYSGGNGITVYNSNPTIVNNIISENVGSGCYSYSPGNWYVYPKLYSNIIYKNYGCGLSRNTYNGSYVLLYNCYFGNISGNLCTSLVPGTGDIQNDPKLVNYPNDLHLGTASPCVNTGITGFEWYDCDGTRNDMGIYGGPDADCGPGPVVTNLQLISPAVVKGETFDIQATGVTR